LFTGTSEADAGLLPFSGNGFMTLYVMQGKPDKPMARKIRFDAG
jgi:hypothetical protein